MKDEVIKPGYFPPAHGYGSVMTETMEGDKQRLADLTRRSAELIEVDPEWDW